MSVNKSVSYWTKIDFVLCMLLNLFTWSMFNFIHSPMCASVRARACACKLQKRKRKLYKSAKQNALPSLFVFVELFVQSAYISRWIYTHKHIRVYRPNYAVRCFYSNKNKDMCWIIHLPRRRTWWWEWSAKKEIAAIEKHFKNKI